MSLVSTCSAPGKVILFGEHAVVYGYPAIAIAIDKRAQVSLFETKSMERSLLVPDLFSDHSFIFDNEEKIPQQLKAVYTLLQSTGVIQSLKPGHRIVIKSQIPPSAGLGSSAAVSVALSKLISKIKGENFSLDYINKLAFEAERIQHGTPSGIDNFISTFGGGVFYSRNSFDRIDLSNLSLHLVVVNTMVRRNTRDLVLKVRKMFDKDRKAVETIFNEIQFITGEARGAMREGNVEKIGELMDLNQNELDKLGVGHEEITRVTRILKDGGALGAKLTGAGGGGCVIGVFSNEEEASLAATKAKNKGYQVFKTVHSLSGVREDGIEKY